MRITSQQRKLFPFLQERELAGKIFTLEELSEATGYPLQGSVKAKMSRGEWDPFIVQVKNTDSYMALGTLDLTLNDFVFKISSRGRRQQNISNTGLPNDGKVFRLWKPVTFGVAWERCETNQIDEVKDAWFSRRKVLENSSKEFNEFLDQIKREHAIETGIVERLYTLDRGVTDTFIKQGFVESYISHEDTNVPVPKLLAYLTDHMEAIDFVFDVVKEDRKLSVGFIHGLHALVTRSQDSAEGRDSIGNKRNIPLLKGKFKELENNPSRADGTTVLYCPPLQVASEMDTLMQIYRKRTGIGTHPIILAAWFHHAFTTIHPYQDGNGRLARLLTSLILIKHGFFPFTVQREEAKEKYITALEQADRGNPQPLVSYLSQNQRRSIEHALNLREVTTDSLDEVTRILSGKLEALHGKEAAERTERLSVGRNKAFEICYKAMEDSMERLRKQFNGNTEIELSHCPPSGEHEHYYLGQVIKYAKHHNYYFNRSLPKGWVRLDLRLGTGKHYRFHLTLHHYGYDDSVLAIGAFLEHVNQGQGAQERVEAALPLDIKPHLLSAASDMTPKANSITRFVQQALTVALAHIASEL